MASAEHSNICQQLKVGDLVKVLDLLKCNDYSETNYFNLGLRLGLSVNTIKTIEANHTDIGRRLSECLTKWLEKADDVQKTKSGPTVYSLVSVLRETEQHAAAEGIEKQYAVADGTEKNPACKIFAGFTSNQSLLTALPKMVLLLQSEKLIEEIMCIKKEEKILLNEISKAVYIDSKKLEVFATILLQYSATIEIGSTIMREFRKVFYCDESCTDLAKKDALSSSASKFKSMHMKFCSTFNKVELIIKEYPSLTQDKIKTTLLNYSEDLMPQLAQCQNIQAILELVRKYCSLNDIEMLKFFVMELNIDEAKVVIQEYSDVIEEFSKTELSKCLNEKFSDATPLQCERIAIVFDQKTDACTLDNVRILSANIFHKLSSPQNSRTIKLFLISDSNNFFTITCSFPLILSEQLITAALNNIDVLKENKVKRLTIGYCTVYEATETVDTPTLSYEKQLLSPSSGLSKQLMLSLSIQLINCKDEELKNKMHGVETMKNEISRQKSDETGQLLHQKVTEKETDDESNQAKNLLITESSQSTQEAFGTSFEPTVTKALREDKVFLYEIVVNRMSGLDVNRMDYTMRDAGVLGKRIYFKWRKFLNRICVKVCPDGKKHICANEDDLDTYNGFFGDRHTLFRELYFERKNRIVATMVNRILKKCGEAKFIRGPDGKRLSLIDAIKKMDTYSRLNDGILDVINETVDDSEVEKLIKFLRSSKLFIPIGYVKNCQLERGSQQLKEEIAEKVEGLEKDDIIVDTEKSGYEEAKDQFMYYVSSNGTVQKWIIEWQSPPAGTFPARWGVFYTKHDKEMVAKIKNGIQKVVQENGGNVDIFKNETDVDLIPVEDPGSSD
uniref:Death domain-containing protein n=1 Tax=Amphimedon queenslandica TaxID=400682 RepID=A0A1X7TLI2_AMPQE